MAQATWQILSRTEDQGTKYRTLFAYPSCTWYCLPIAEMHGKGASQARTNTYLSIFVEPSLVFADLCGLRIQAHLRLTESRILQFGF